MEDSFIGCRPDNIHSLVDKVGEGRIGSVYKAVGKNPDDVLACKVIPEGRLKKGWEHEIEKVIKLRSVPNVVSYYGHGTGIDNNSRPFIWVNWNFIDGLDLKHFITEKPWPLDLAFITDIAKTILEVLFACRQVDIVHGDLHEGNIMISKPDLRRPGSPRIIWITDFGYGGSHTAIVPKDDYRQFFSIISNLLSKLIPTDLNPRDRVLHEKYLSFLAKRVMEIDPTQGKYVGNPQSLISDFALLGPSAERESALAKADGMREPGDYLVAEALGYRVDEWRNLFVPEFLAAQDLLSRNIVVLTGARGCGKTMTFRRLTAYMDKVIGEPSRVIGADKFIGFYINCRNLVEAFPWMPQKLKRSMQAQIIHYFHLAWFAEITKTLSIYDPDNEIGYGWLDGFLTGLFGSKYHSLPEGADILAHAQSFIEDQKEFCRIIDLGKFDSSMHWPLDRIDFLDILQYQLETHLSWIGDKPLYFFLDDYTIPIVTREVQKTLNPIVFKRRSKIFFKISTEAANSFDLESIRGKPLELHQDFELIDLATESLHQDDKDKEEFLNRVFRPRIDRHVSLKGKNIGLKELFGDYHISNNLLAQQLRTGGKTRIYYHGMKAFVGMWSSDIRIMIQMLTDVLREANGALKKKVYRIDKTIQDKVYRSTGGEFLVFSESVTNPSMWEKGPSSIKPDEPYGKRLRNIVEAFVNISRYELTKGMLVSNQGRKNPKQAFRLEIIDKFDLPNDVKDFYHGIVRWHLFLQDWRGKSVRGMVTPRLYLNRVLIPFSNLTFSSHDNIHLTNDEFIILLKDPAHFLQYWKDKRKYKKKYKKIHNNGNASLSLWDAVSKDGKL